MTLRDTEIGRCPDGPPRGRTWFNVTVVASAHMVEIFTNDRFTVTSTPRHVTRGCVGIVALNAHRNTGHFSLPLLTKTEPTYGKYVLWSNDTDT